MKLTKKKLAQHAKRKAMRAAMWNAAVERNERDANGQLVIPTKYRKRRAARAAGAPMASRAHETPPWWRFAA